MGVVHPIKLKTRLACILEASESKRIACGKNLYNQKEKLRHKQKSSQSSQPNPNPDHDRTVKLVVCPQRGALHSQEIETRSFREHAVTYDRTGKLVVCRDENHMRHQSRGVINVDLVPSNVRFSHQEALLYVFQDNEAVIKMIIKGRTSPTMRHVSRRTHRVALDWLFDRINLDPKIHIKYI